MNLSVNTNSGMVSKKWLTSSYFWCVFLFWIVALTLIFSYNQLELHRKLNAFHHSFLDAIFPYATHVGDGIFALLLVVIFYFVSKKKSLILFVSFVLSSWIVQVLKQLVFYNSYRPFHYFRNDEHFHFVNDVVMHTQNSFPSGHSTTCFAIFTSLALFFWKNQKLQFVLSICAILFSLTRVYLSQHFLEDVIAGSLIGTITAVLVGNYIPKISMLKKLQ